jgi:hypothetical protein
VGQFVQGNSRATGGGSERWGVMAAGGLGGLYGEICLLWFCFNERLSHISRKFGVLVFRLRSRSSFGSSSEGSFRLASMWPRGRVPLLVIGATSQPLSDGKRMSGHRGPQNRMQYVVMVGQKHDVMAHTALCDIQQGLRKADRPSLTACSRPPPLGARGHKPRGRGRTTHRWGADADGRRPRCGA